ncbi:MAG TPA: hypothetical protein VFX98_07915, partial [Longimicrobiaceae bacterium]|nr:hypothetical protein [Longimicrobiaceae bacterium]
MTQPTVPPPRAERVALPRELSNFLVELAIALQTHGTYPAGHPFLARSVETVWRRLEGLLLERDLLSFGVARRQLVIEGVATDPANPVLGGLAGRLHRHRVGAVSLHRGVAPEEVADLLSVLAADAPEGAPPPAWPHVRLHALSYAELELASEDAGEGTRAEALRAAQLWIGLARAALAAGEGAEAGTPEAAAVAQAIDAHPQAQAYDQVIVGYLLQLARELREEGGAGSAEVRRRMSEMIHRLSPETLRRLVELGGDAAQRRSFVLDASHGFAAEAVVKLVEAAAEAQRQPVSGSLLRLLSKLAAHAEGAPGPAGAAADAALREQVQWLVSGWSLEDPNPEAYGAVLEGLSHARAGAAGALPGRHEPEPERIVQTALEVGAAGPAAEAAVLRLLGEGRAAALARLLAEAPEPTPFAEEAW